MWLGDLYGPVMAALVVAVVYTAIAIAALIWLAVARRRTIETARVELAAAPNWIADPALLTVGLLIGRTLGWRKVVPLAVAGVLAIGLSVHASTTRQSSSST